MLTVRFLAHFDVRDRVSARFDVTNLRCGIFGRGIQDSDGNHGRQAARYSAGEKEIESDLIPAGFS
jgi:hypothetical protein